MSITRDIKTALNGVYGALIRLLVINIVVWLLANIIISVLTLGGDRFAMDTLSDWIVLPAPLSHFLPRFWTIFTYMFVHFSGMHLLMNMLWLYFLGRIFSDLLGGARMTGAYILGGISGGILFMLVSNFIPHQSNSTLEGASAGVMAIIVAAAAYSPDYMLHFAFPRMSVKLKWVALVSFVLFSLINLTDNTGGKVAHMGGALFGFLYGTQLRSGKNFLERFMNVFRVNKSKLRVAHTRSARASDEIYNENKVSIKKRVDEILDKISRSGYDSLSKEEKGFLQKNHDKF